MRSKSAGVTRLSIKAANVGVLPARQMIFDVIGDLLADRRQLKQFVLDDRIVGPLGKVPIHGRLVPEIVRPIHAAQSQSVEVVVANADGLHSLIAPESVCSLQLRIFA
jgi:hypothetical protein